MNLLITKPYPTALHGIACDKRQRLGFYRKENSWKIPLLFYSSCLSYFYAIQNLKIDPFLTLVVGSSGPILVIKLDFLKKHLFAFIRAECLAGTRSLECQLNEKFERVCTFLAIEFYISVYFSTLKSENLGRLIST